MKIRLSIFLLLLTAGLIVPARSYSAVNEATEADSASHWGASLSVMPGRAIAVDEWQKKWQKGTRNWAADLKLTRATLPTDSDAYASDYGYPTLSAGLRWSFNHGITTHKGIEFWGEDENALKEVGYDSRMGNILSLYGEFARPLVRRRHWEVDYTIDMGFGYSPYIYNKVDAIDNELIGSHLLIFFGAGVHATYHFAHDWGLRLGLDFYHHSNGAVDRPNKGANIVAPSLGIVYQPYYEASVAEQPKRSEPFASYWYLNLSASAGVRSLIEEWQLTQFYTNPGDEDYRTGDFKHYMAYSASADVMWRYARRWATGLGVDVFYGDYDKRVKEISLQRGYDETVSPWSVGIAAKHEAFYHRLSLNVSLGFYLYRKMGTWARELEAPYYERIGLNYSFPRLGGLKIGVNVKAHKTKADLTELLISYPATIFAKKNRKKHQ